MRFNGPAYSPTIDDKRLSDQHVRIRDLMLDQVWRTLREIATTTNDPESSISAQLRHMRKARFGSYVVEMRARLDRKYGLWEYRVLPSGTPTEQPMRARINKFKEALTLVWRHPETTPKVKEDIREFLAQFKEKKKAKKDPKEKPITVGDKRDERGADLRQ